MAVVKFKLGAKDAFKKSTAVAIGSLTKYGTWAADSDTDYYYSTIPTNYVELSTFNGTGIKINHRIGSSAGVYNMLTTARVEIRDTSTSDGWIRYPNINMYNTSDVVNDFTIIDMNLPYGSYTVRIMHKGITGERMSIGTFTHYGEVTTTIQDAVEAFTFTVNPSDYSEELDVGEPQITAGGRILKNNIGLPTNTINIAGMKISKSQKRKFDLFISRNDTLVLVDDRDGGDNLHLVQIVSFRPERRHSTYSEKETWSYSMTLKEQFYL